jgi:hypothetical protein
VKRRVEARDRLHLRQRRLHGVQRRQGLRLVQRRERRQLAQRGLDVRVDQDGLAEALAAVHDPVADRVRRPQRGQLGGEVLRLRREVAGAEQLVAGPDQPQLEAARAGVDD